MLPAALILLATPAALLCDAAHVTLLPLLGFSAVLLFDRMYLPRACFSRRNRSRMLSAAGLTILFFAMLPVTSLLRSPLFSEAALADYWWPARILRLLYLAWNWTGYLGALLVSVFFLLDWALYRFDRHAEATPNTIQAPLARSELLLRMLPVIVSALFCTFSTFPSMSTADDQTVWMQATEGIWSDGHAIGYVLFVKLCSLIAYSPFTVVIVQSAAFLFIQLSIARRLSRLPGGARAVSLYAGVCALVFTPCYYLQCMLKDTVFSMCFLALSFCVYALMEAERPHVSDWIFFACFTLCVSLFRNEGKAAAGVLLLVLLGYCAVKRREMLRPLAVSALSAACLWTLIVPIFAFGVIKAEANEPYTVFSAAMYNACAVVSEKGDALDGETLRLMEEIMPLETWQACYQKYNSDPASRPWSTVGDRIYLLNEPYYQMLVLRLNLRLLVRQPGAYLTAAFDQNSIVWEISRPADGGEMALVYARLKDYDRPEDELLTLGGSAITHPYYTLLADVPLLRALCLRGGFSLFALIFSAVALLRKQRRTLLFALLPAALWTLIRLFSTPVSDPRYVLPLLECACLFPILAFFVPPAAPEK